MALPEGLGAGAGQFFQEARRKCGEEVSQTWAVFRVASSPCAIWGRPAPPPTLPHAAFFCTLEFWFLGPESMALCRLTHSCLCASVSHLWTDGVVVFRLLWQQDQHLGSPGGTASWVSKRYQHPDIIICAFPHRLELGRSKEQGGVHEPAEASPEQSKGSRPRTWGICQPLCPGSAVCSPGQEPPALVTGTDHGHFWVVAPASHPRIIPRKSGTMGR